MGNDGGSIPTRRELVKETSRNPTTAELKESQHEQQEYYWTTDPISRQPLAQPVVSDFSGKLYNKDTILEYLVEGSRKADADTVTQGHVTSLRDVVEVKFEVDADATAIAKMEVWKCPVTGDKLGPGSKAVYLVPCGHAFSGSAIKEVSGEKCLVCNDAYAANDIIPILPTTATDAAWLSLRVKTLKDKGLTHALKKAPGSGKKRKHKPGAIEAVTEITASGGPEEKKSTPQTPLPTSNQKETNGVLKGIKNSSTATLTAKVLEEQQTAKRRKIESGNVRSLFSAQDQNKPSGKSSDFMTRGYSISTSAKR